MNNIRLYISSLSYFKKRMPSAVRIISMDEYVNTCDSIPLFSQLQTTTYYYTSTDLDKEVIKKLEKTKNIVYFVDEDIDKRSYLYKLCKRNDTIYNEPGIKKAYIKEKYPQLSDYSIELIMNNSPNFSRKNMVMKLLKSFNKVTDDKVSWLFSGDYEDKIFKTLDYLFEGNVTLFYKYYGNLINLGESKFKILILLYRRLKTLLVVKSYHNDNVKEIQNKTGLNYYAVKNNLPVVNMFSTKILRNWFLECGRIERDIKYGKSNEDVDLEILLLKILRRTSV